MATIEPGEGEMKIVMELQTLHRLKTARTRLDPEISTVETWSDTLNRVLDHLEILQERINEDIISERYRDYNFDDVGLSEPE